MTQKFLGAQPKLSWPLTRSSRFARAPHLLAGALVLSSLLLGSWTWATLRAVPPALLPMTETLVRSKYLDRYGRDLSVTYTGQWNYADTVALHQVPQFLRQAILASEDRRFFDHGGPDWIARSHAVIQNAAGLRFVRGASTITEQVVRMHRSRKRGLWARWLEGFEAVEFEERYSKGELLEFYLNQVPFSAQRRGVVQAARYYFDRSLETLSPKEMLALAVLIRSPSRLAEPNVRAQLDRRINLVADALVANGVIARQDAEKLKQQILQFQSGPEPLEASHFVRFGEKAIGARTTADSRIGTTLDGNLQQEIQKLAEQQLRMLKRSDVSHAAILVVEHDTGAVRAWVNAAQPIAADGKPVVNAPQSAIHFDGVLTLRQPGSALKPFLYAAALEQGWTAATIIEDEPLTRPVGLGLHTFRNYSNTYYGPVRLRTALGNSLNIPAVKAIEFVGVSKFLARLHDYGFNSLRRESYFYGPGLALGNGEISLYELVRAYATLARRGKFRELHFRDNDPTNRQEHRVVSSEISSLVADILSDSRARQLEFRGGLFSFPIQTAVKTGTSSDFRDAWAVGFNHRYTVGIWMGNMDGRPTKEVNGSRGPGFILRAIFAELSKGQESRPLYRDDALVRRAICEETGKAQENNCSAVEEYFLRNTVPLRASEEPPAKSEDPGHYCQQMELPSPGLQLAMDPRIPDQLEGFEMRLPRGCEPLKTTWIVDNETLAVTGEGAREFTWSVQPGAHVARAEVHFAGHEDPVSTHAVNFVVH